MDRMTPDQEVKLKLALEVEKRLADQGKLVEGGWRAMVIVGKLENAPADQLAELRKAYFTGAHHVFASLIGIMDEDREPTEKDLRRVELLYRELEEFVKELKSGQN